LNELIDNLVILISKGVVVTIRSFSSVLVFALILCAIFPGAQVGWSLDIMCGSTGDGSAQARDFNDAGATTDFEDDSQQETLDGCVISRMSVSDCESSRFLVSINEIPPSTLLAFRLFHPPTSQS
jgi:hypothetical protein